MLDRYLFRGRTLRGAWHLGDWHIGTLSYQQGCTLVFPKDAFDSFDQYIVDESTIGQCTGLHDKDETLIFEGDILRGDDYDMAYEVIWHADYAGWFCNPLDDSRGVESLQDLIEGECVIVGNIHDTPERLKEANSDGQQGEN